MVTDTGTETGVAPAEKAPPQPQRPQVVEIPPELEGVRVGAGVKTEERKQYHKLRNEQWSQRVELAGVVRTEIRQILDQIPGLKEAALDAIYNGQNKMQFTLPDGKILSVYASNEYNPYAGSSEDIDEYGDFIDGSGAKVSFANISTGVQILDGPERKSTAGIALNTRVWKFEDGRISSQDASINAHDRDDYSGFGNFGNDATAKEVLEKVDKVEDALRGYTRPA